MGTARPGGRPAARRAPLRRAMARRAPPPPPTFNDTDKARIFLRFFPDSIAHRMEKNIYKRADMKSKKDTAAMSLRVAGKRFGDTGRQRNSRKQAVHAVRGRKVEAVC